MKNIIFLLPLLIVASQSPAQAAVKDPCSLYIFSEVKKITNEIKRIAEERKYVLVQKQEDSGRQLIVNRTQDNFPIPSSYVNILFYTANSPDVRDQGTYLTLNWSKGNARKALNAFSAEPNSKQPDEGGLPICPNAVSK